MLAHEFIDLVDQDRRNRQLHPILPPPRATQIDYEHVLTPFEASNAVPSQQAAGIGNAITTNLAADETQRQEADALRKTDHRLTEMKTTV